MSAPVLPKGHDEYAALAVAWAIDALEPADQQRFEAHRDGCDDCEQTVRAALEVAVELAHGVPDIAPPPSLRLRVLSAAIPERTLPGEAPGSPSDAVARSGAGAGLSGGANGAAEGARPNDEDDLAAGYGRHAAPRVRASDHDGRWAGDGGRADDGRDSRDSHSGRGRQDGPGAQGGHGRHGGDAPDQHGHGGHGRGAHGPDGHDDARHGDGAHGDAGQSDGGQSNGGHTDAGHTDAGHTDARHTDARHTDAGHTDGGQSDGGHTDGRRTDGRRTGGGHLVDRRGPRPGTVSPLRRSRRRLVSVFAAAALVGLSAVTTWQVTRPAPVSAPIAAADRVATLTSTDGNRALATVVVRDGRVDVVADGLPTTTGTTAYYVWGVPAGDAGVPQVVGTFEVTEDGLHSYPVRLTRAIGDYPVLAVSQEQAGSTPTAPSDVLARGTLG